MALKDSLKKFVFGGEEVVGADPEAQDLKRIALDAATTQKMGLADLQKVTPQEFAESQIAQQSAALQGNLADVRRRIQQNIARRGIQNTSIGQTAIAGAERGVGRDINLLQASAPQLRNQYAENLIRQGGIVAQSQNVPLRFQEERTPRQGILGLLGTVAGGAIGASGGGGPQGAMVGSQIGGGLGTGISGMFR